MRKFLAEHALRTNKRELEAALSAVGEETPKQAYRKGLSFKTLLQNLSRHIDWITAEALETEFLRRHPKTRLYDDYSRRH